MQAFLRWTPPGGTLGTICGESEARAALLTPRAVELERLAATAPTAPSLAAALRRTDVALVAEVKRKSPSKGSIAPHLDAVAQAQAYVAGGAAAISVLTEPAHFSGSLEDLKAVRAELPVPALKKDFHVRPIQLLEARGAGASAALLIARALDPERLRQMMEMGRALGLELLVEIRDEAELDRALEAGATMIGVNNRDLESLIIDPTTAERLVPRIPSGIIAIAESGMKSRADIERYAQYGADAVLVGSSISAAADPAAATRTLTGVPRIGRAS